MFGLFFFMFDKKKEKNLFLNSYEKTELHELQELQRFKLLI